MMAGKAGRSRTIGSVILRLDNVPSTSLLALGLADSGCPDGTIVLSKNQTAGRGRRGRAWHSHPGGLWFSVVLRPGIPAHAAQVLTFLGAVASARALRWAGVPVSLKWPNDIVWNGRKMGGILTEAVVSGGRMKYAVTGIGINISGTMADFPAGLRRSAVTASRAAGKSVDRDALFRAIISNMNSLYSALRRPAGRKALVEEWGNLAEANGKRVVLREGGRRWTGAIRGFGQDGSLLMAVDGGGEKVFHSGEIGPVKGMAGVKL